MQPESLNPVEEFLFPLAAFFCAFFLAGAEAVASCLILNVTMFYLVGGQRGVEQHRVVVFHDGVVDAVDDENGRTVVGDMTFQGEGVTHYLVVLTFLAEQSTP